MNPAWQGWAGEEQGMSAFLRHGDRVFHTYSAYGRGTEPLIAPISGSTSPPGDGRRIGN